eukprot:GHUV01031995.1.p2 GENE.GHUV01031995.1~~GHUV01031995.1.p2  ORF type:complete len:138 (+),score=43.52 GHUV01031995.1:510-923(+)
MDLQSYISQPGPPGDNDYFTRFYFDHEAGKFHPSQVPVFCLCQWPYNPDLVMINCRSCDEWYHPECLPIDAVPDSDDPGLLANWICPECAQDTSDTMPQRQQLQQRQQEQKQYDRSPPPPPQQQQQQPQRSQHEAPQ